jgi:hypothetical protein
MIVVLLVCAVSVLTIITIALEHLLCKTKRQLIESNEALREVILECRDVDRWCAEFPDAADAARFLDYRANQIVRDRSVPIREIIFPHYAESVTRTDTSKWAPHGRFEVSKLRDAMRTRKEP